MKLILLFLVLFLSCVKEEVNTSKARNLTATTSEVTTKSDDFSDLKKEGDEGCGSEEDLEKKIMEEAKKKPEKAFKLQGGDTGCSTD